MKKRILAAILAALLLWLIVAAVDAYRVVREFERPFFCILTDSADDGGSGTYVGLGYSFVIKGNFMPEDEFPGVTCYEMKLFGLEVGEGIRD